MTTSTQPGKPSAIKPAAVPYGKDDPKRRQALLIAGVGGVALVVAAALLFIFRPWKPTAQSIRLNDAPAKVAQAVATDDFSKMPFERREVYMKMMSAKKAQVVQAHAAGQLNDVEYEKALTAAHLGKKLDEMKKYFAKPAGAERQAYLDKVINKKETKNAAEKKDQAAKDEKKEEDIFRSTAAEDAEMATWPGEVQSKYAEFKSAYDERKKAFKTAHPKAQKAATLPGSVKGAATNP